MSKILTISQISLACGMLACPAPVRGADANKPDAAPAATQGYKNVTVEQFDKLRGDKANVVLDVRTPQEFAAGHIPGAVNLDVRSPDFEKKAKELDKTKTYLVHCAAGRRSAAACGQMSGLNFTNCYNLLGGMRAWEKAGKPVEK